MYIKHLYTLRVFYFAKKAESGTSLLGLITEVTHSLGKSGFFTEFTADSGGRARKGVYTDFIQKYDASAVCKCGGKFRMCINGKMI